MKKYKVYVVSPDPSVDCPYLFPEEKAEGLPISGIDCSGLKGALEFLKDYIDNIGEMESVKVLWQWFTEEQIENISEHPNS